ncbi:MAG: photosystem II protein PsbQ [Synechococcales cyanobacterium M58_A2018_015]|nr:photosystem II protein PsbQ [Synechococcales cyanobacterium M58_A2018_015]
MIRSVLALLLAVITVFLVSCGSSTPTAQGPTYTTAQLEQIQRAADDVQALRDRLLELSPLIQQRDWNNVESFIHGPLGELRAKMSRLARSLSPDTQKAALAAAKDVFEHLNLIDEAAQAQDPTKAFNNYNEALKDFDVFFQYIPQNTQA